jgi:transcriptional regulator with XRE-family HTH domain
LNLSQRKIADRLGVSQGLIWSIENGKRKPSEKILERLNKLLPKNIEITLEEIKNRLNQISESGKFKGEFAKMMSLRASKERSLKGELKKPPTEQEKDLIEKFTKEKIPFKFKSIVRTKKRKFVVDFAFPDDRNTEILLEVKNSQKISRKRNEAIQLAFKAIKIKSENKKVKLFALLEGVWPEEALSIIKEDFDKVFMNSKELITYLKSVL